MAADNHALDPRKMQGEVCEDWKAVAGALDSFPPRTLTFDENGDLTEQVWVFRGHKSADYRLSPTIEREAGMIGGVDWDALETLLYDDFVAKARSVVDPRDLPGSGARFNWLALMQHHGAPTRLLDFTLSPYIALYFALRSPTGEERKNPAAVWAIDAKTLLSEASRRSSTADSEEEEHGLGPRRKRHAVSYVSCHPARTISSADQIRGEREAQGWMLDKALSASTVRRYSFNNTGFVMLALSPVEDRRVSSQQGAFLLSGATHLTFEESLYRTMKDHAATWVRLFRFPASLRSELERRLFQMNVHDLSLFPDTEGLVGFVRQKARLQMA